MFIGTLSELLFYDQPKDNLGRRVLRIPVDEHKRNQGKQSVERRHLFSVVASSALPSLGTATLGAGATETWELRLLPPQWVSPAGCVPTPKATWATHLGYRIPSTWVRYIQVWAAHEVWQSQRWRVGIEKGEPLPQEHTPGSCRVPTPGPSPDPSALMCTGDSVFWIINVRKMFGDVEMIMS
jgi:hypothetical protein